MRSPSPLRLASPALLLPLLKFGPCDWTGGHPVRRGLSGRIGITSTPGADDQSDSRAELPGAPLCGGRSRGGGGSRPRCSSSAPGSVPRSTRPARPNEMRTAISPRPGRHDRHPEHSRREAPTPGKRDLPQMRAISMSTHVGRPSRSPSPGLRSCSWTHQIAMFLPVCHYVHATQMETGDRPTDPAAAALPECRRA